MKSTFFLILPLVAFFTLSGCNEDESVMESQNQYKRDNNFNKPGDDTIFDIVADALPDEFNNLYAAIQYVDAELDAGLEDAIKSDELQLTVFAPTDQAFVDLIVFLREARNQPELVLSDIPAPIVLAVLQYHLTNGRRGSNSVVPRNGDKRIQTLLTGASFTVDNTAKISPIGGTPTGPTAQIGPAGPASFNISASNGIIHVIDAVLLPLAPGDILALWDSLEE